MSMVVDSYSVRVPTYIKVSKKATKAVNLNIYRNLHYHHLNVQKQAFYKEVKPQLKHHPRAKKVWIHYEIFASRNGRLDTMNVGSIVDKYFSDTLVECGKLEDDDYNNIILSTFSFGGVCPMDGHAIATVNIIDTEKENPMRVLLDQEDIQAALEAYIEDLNLPAVTGVELIVTDDGEIEAEIQLGEPEDKESDPPEPKPKTNKRSPGRPKGSKNKPKVETSAEKEEEEADGPLAGDTAESSDDSDTGGAKAAERDPEEEQGEVSSDKDGGGKRKNLFGDEETQSSDSAKAETDSPKEVETDSPKPKKSSIFDID